MLKSKRDGELLEGETAPFTVWGPTCDSLDQLRYQPQLPLGIAEDDWVEFALMGGYGSSTATRFNGFVSDQYVRVDEGFPYEEAILE